MRRKFGICAYRAKHPQIVEREREITNFYKRSSEAGADHIRQSRVELLTRLNAGEDFEALLSRWQTELLAQIVGRRNGEMEDIRPTVSETNTLTVKGPARRKE